MPNSDPSLPLFSAAYVLSYAQFMMECQKDKQYTLLRGCRAWLPSTMQGARSVFPCARGGDEHKLDINNKRVRTHLYLREQVSFYRFCQMQAELHASVQVQSHFSARLLLWDSKRGPRRKPLFGGFTDTFTSSFQLQVANPTFPPSHPPLKSTKQFTNPYLFVCLWLLPMLLIAPGPSLLFERAAV